MKSSTTHLVLNLLAFIIGGFPVAAQKIPSGSAVFIPAGGNAWVTGGSDAVNKEGVVNWSDPKSICTIYVRVQPGDLLVSLNLASSSAARVKVTIHDIAKEVDVVAGVGEHLAGNWPIAAPGYVAVALQGLSKSGDYFGTLSGITISGSAVGEDLSYVKNNEGNFFYWGRRGPSVHLRYDMLGRTDVEYFYSEITVPAGNDVIGSYYMANGFSDGYVGMQVNSEKERRVLFSVWSPFQTDDPKSIPEADRILLQKKGEGVYTGEFGNEGSGGQSYLRYPWRAGISYGFLLRAQPQGIEATTYTAWFFAPEKNQWALIASWRRPKKAAYLSGLYSFLENFTPETGKTTRMARYGNQWICDASGSWHEIIQAKFTADNTARKNYRKDYGGGVADGAFFLRNCGFFNDFTRLEQLFDRPERGIPPTIDFAKLP